MNYTPYPVIDMRQGLLTSVDAWLLPKDAFKTLTDCYLRKGVITKRKGYTVFGQVRHTSTTAGTTAASTEPVMGLLPYINGTNEYKLAFNTKRINQFNESTLVFDDLTRHKVHVRHGSVGQNHAPVVGDSVEGLTSTHTATIESVVLDNGSWTGGTADGTIIFTNTSAANAFHTGETLVQADNHANIFGVADGASTDSESTGNDKDYFHLANWNNTAYITNGQDQLQKYNGISLSRLYIDLDGEDEPDGVNHVDSARFVFLYHNRLVLLRTTERTTETWPLRARWCQVDNPAIWFDSAYTDISAHGQSIVSASIIYNELIIQCTNSTWVLTYTGDTVAPFRWNQISSIKGSASQNGILVFGNETICISNTGIIICNNTDAVDMDSKIPDEVLTWNTNAAEYSYGLIMEQERLGLLSYTSTTASEPDKILVFNYEDKAWSIFNIPSHCFGKFKSGGVSDPSIDTIAIDMDTLDYSGEDILTTAGFPIYLMGSTDGYVYKLNDSYSDNGTDISFEVQGGEWNPFYKDGYNASLGWTNLLISVETGNSFVVKNYITGYLTAANSTTVECDPTTINTSKKTVKVMAGNTAEFHSINLSNTNSLGQIKIHAIIPFFMKAGRL
jgi:hypothetical protein